MEEIKQMLIEKVGPLIREMICEIENNKYSTEKCCWPFMPYIGSKYSTSNKKILIVGKATKGWGGDGGAGKLSEVIKKPDFLKCLSELTDNFIKKRVTPYYAGSNDKNNYQSSFWRRIYRLTSALLNGESELPEYKLDPVKSTECFESIAWTNIFKISAIEGNPPKELINIIKNLCIEALYKEIEVLQPNIILFSTGKSYDCYLKEFLNISDSDIDSNKEITSIKIKDFDGVAFRTTHFQALRNSKLEELYNTLKGKKIQ